MTESTDWYFDDGLVRLRRTMTEAHRHWEDVRPAFTSDPIQRQNLSDEQLEAMRAAMEAERAYFDKLHELRKG